MRTWPTIRQVQYLSWLPWLWLVSAPISVAAPKSHEPQIFWHSIPVTGSEQEEGRAGLAARGFVVTRGTQAEITLTLVNQDRVPLTCSYIVDEYIASTSTGRTVSLEKSDFFSYPTLLAPGTEATVKLNVPKDVKWQDIAQIRATLNTGKTRLILKPLSTFASTGAPAPMQPEGQTPSRPPLIVPSPALAVSSPEGPSAVPVLEVPIAGIPVVVEFTQELGSSLTVEVQWDKSEDAIIFVHGDRRTIQLLPGPHVLHVSSRLPSIAETRGEVPVMVTRDETLRIMIEARARLTGVELSVQLWESGHLITEELFTPGTHDPPT